MSPNVPDDEIRELVSSTYSDPSDSSRRDFQSFQEEMRELEMKRRRENIHVLVALGVIGAYFSFVSNANVEFLTSLQQDVTLFLVLMSGFFLFVKMSTITFRPDFDHRWINIIDERFAPAMYMMSIYGLLLVGAISWLSTALPELPQGILEGLIFLALLILAIGIVFWVARVSMINTAKEEERIYQRLLNTMTALHNEGEISESRSEEIMQRFERILGSREDLTRFHYLLSLNDDTPSSPFVLKPRDRRRIRNIIERIGIKVAQERKVVEDVETIEELLTEIEER